MSWWTGQRTQADSVQFGAWQRVRGFMVTTGAWDDVVLNGFLLWAGENQSLHRRLVRLRSR